MKAEQANCQCGNTVAASEMVHSLEYQSKPELTMYIVKRFLRRISDV